MKICPAALSLKSKGPVRGPETAVATHGLQPLSPDRSTAPSC
jgi:hypothetical protein